MLYLGGIFASAGYSQIYR